MEIYQNRYLVSFFSKGLLYLHRGLFADLLFINILFNFSCKNSTFYYFIFDQDPDPYWFGSLDPDQHLDKKLDPDPH
jgi:hypothetical protein